MKNPLPIMLSFLFGLATLTTYGQPIENNDSENEFSLEIALELFKTSKTLEDFEAKLNDETKYVNNLDLNDDGEIDYIKVIDLKENDLHAIVLQVDISKSESQDIAVIEIAKIGHENAELQIVGDEDVFGEEVVLEPTELEPKVSVDGGPSANYEFFKVVVNVWAWSCVRHLYHPNYIVYRSPWRWGHYPKLWKPWRPHPVSLLVTKRTFYRPSCHRIAGRRITSVHSVYAPRRVGSVTVKKRTSTRFTKSKNGKVVTKKTSTKAVGKSNNGKVKGVKKTTTTKAKSRRKN